MESYGISNTSKNQIFRDFWSVVIDLRNTLRTFLRTHDFCSRIHVICSTENLKEDALLRVYVYNLLKEIQELQVYS